jgi:hypothetical protein
VSKPRVDVAIAVQLQPVVAVESDEVTAVAPDHDDAVGAAAEIYVPFDLARTE